MRKRAYDIVEYFQVEVADAENQNKSRRGRISLEKRKREVVHEGGPWRGISTRDSLACNESEAALGHPTYFYT